MSTPEDDPILILIGEQVVCFKMASDPGRARQVPAMAGYRRNTDWLWATQPEKFYEGPIVGDQVLCLSSEYSRSPVFKAGCLDIDVMSHLCMHVFLRILKVDPAEHPVHVFFPAGVEVPIHDAAGGSTTPVVIENLLADESMVQQLRDVFNEAFQSPEVRISSLDQGNPGDFL
jgi:hypothetical protein